MVLDLGTMEKMREFGRERDDQILRLRNEEESKGFVEGGWKLKS